MPQKIGLQEAGFKDLTGDDDRGIIWAHFCWEQQHQGQWPQHSGVALPSAVQVSRPT
jgi:hypothetical protein